MQCYNGFMTDFYIIHSRCSASSKLLWVLIFIAWLDNHQVMCYQKLPCDEQIKDLLRRKNFKEAISLAEDLECAGEMSKDMLYFVHAQIGFLLLFDLQFEEAVNHFLQSETMQPSEIFPFVMKDPNRWSLLVLSRVNS